MENVRNNLFHPMTVMDSPQYQFCIEVVNKHPDYMVHYATDASMCIAI